MDLRTKYMGLELKNPIVPSASPLSQSVDSIKRLADAGASAVVMFSLFEEQLKMEEALESSLMAAGTESFAEALSYFPKSDDYHVGPEQYLELVQKASQAVDIPIIGSLNGVSHEGWVSYARKIQDAGAKALELNIYHLAADPTISGSKVEKMYIEAVKAVKSAVTIPLAVKLSPFFSSISNMSRKLKRAGADALVLFNRFYQPDFDLNDMTVIPSLQLSSSEDIRLPLRWIAMLHGRVRVSLAATSGVQTVEDVVKFVAAGADVVQTASALLKHGPAHVTALVDGLARWLEEHEYKSIRQLKGSMSQKSVENPTAFERANYIKIIEKYKGEYQAV
ncbi:MAG TPA: dihydroorotate dehydrogenase-like protein [Kiritimatiellia bacterium]|nr:dihydroorotate dehydrogenase-like protein [Kiritimatiellia bacterium]